jgi:hypothetical protein
VRRKKRGSGFVKKKNTVSDTGKLFPCSAKLDFQQGTSLDSRTLLEHVRCFDAASHITHHSTDNIVRDRALVRSFFLFFLSSLSFLSLFSPSSLSLLSLFSPSLLSFLSSFFSLSLFSLFSLSSLSFLSLSLLSLLSLFSYFSLSCLCRDPHVRLLQATPLLPLLPNSIAFLNHPIPVVSPTHTHTHTRTHAHTHTHTVHTHTHTHIHAHTHTHTFVHCVCVLLCVYWRLGLVVQVVYVCVYRLCV